MKIISKQHDYYDIVLSYGYDDNCVYKRNEETVKIHKLDFQNYDKISNISYFDVFYNVFKYYKLNIISFCGKIYPSISYSFGDKTSTIYSVNELNILIDDGIKYYGKTFINNFIKKERMLIRNGNKKCSMYSILKDFLLIKNISFDDLHFKYEVPIINIPLRKSVFSSYGYITNDLKVDIVLNPNLKDLEFYKIVNPYDAYMSINSYIIDSLGGNSPNIASISDESMVEKKGFDKKISFRKREHSNERKRRKK
jgi:hypothetical protein